MKKDGGVIRYDIKDLADLKVLVENGLIWRGGPQTVAAAIAAIVQGKVPRPTRNVPPQINDVLDRNHVPYSTPEPETPAEDTAEPGEEPPVA